MLGPLVLVLYFCMPMPKAWSKKTRLRPPPHTKRPDVDNLVKWICDCANEILWCDDAQVTACYSQKLYDEEPKTVMEIYCREFECPDAL